MQDNNANDHSQASATVEAMLARLTRLGRSNGVALRLYGPMTEQVEVPAGFIRRTSQQE